MDAVTRLVTAAKAILNGGFEREDSEYADALFACLQEAVAEVELREAHLPSVKAEEYVRMVRKRGY